MTTANSQTVSITELAVTCEDGIKLAATLYQPIHSSIKNAVMIAPATGIKQNFYRHLATWLADQGNAVITFDNRGIGKSLSGHVKDCPASLQDWGEKDMPAILETLKEKHHGMPYHLIGHSAGGQLVGLMHNAKELASMTNVASSSGNLSNMQFPFKFTAHFFMNAFIPLSNLIFGYTKSHWVGMGEPLPKKAAQQWQRWCNGSGYVKTDFGEAINNHWYDEITLDALWLYATDDDIANKANVKEMAAVFSNCRADIVAIEPAEYGAKTIGHMGVFRSKNHNLWAMLKQQ